MARTKQTEKSSSFHIKQFEAHLETLNTVDFKDSKRNFLRELKKQRDKIRKQIEILLQKNHIIEKRIRGVEKQLEEC